MTRRLRLAFVVSVLAAAVTSVPAASEATPAVPVRDVIVMADTTAEAADAVVAAGGTVSRELDVVHGVAATVPAGAYVRGEVLPDEVVPLASARYGRGDDTSPTSPAASGELRGDGVTVALIDTGVADVPALRGHTELGPDFTAEGDGIDRYGHGTFMAGLIAAVADDATILSIKVAGGDGEARLSDLLAGMQWVADHRVDEHIGVLNLSFGVLSPHGAKGDPLVRAAEALDDLGIVVVAASGNEGSDGVTSPGTSWAAVTVGSSDTHGTADLADDTIAPWSGRGKVGPFEKPDLVAPGVDIVSVRVPGSTIDREFPNARVGTDEFRGSGTSMSAAMVSGAAAVVLGEHPAAAPQDVKVALIDSADPISGGATLDVHGAATTTATGGRTTGWAGARWAGARWAGARWAGARWAGARWADEGWAGARWAGARWAAAIW